MATVRCQLLDAFIGERSRYLDVAEKSFLISLHINIKRIPAKSSTLVLTVLSREQTLSISKVSVPIIRLISKFEPK